MMLLLSCLVLSCVEGQGGVYKQTLRVVGRQVQVLVFRQGLVQVMEGATDQLLLQAMHRG